jgi:hypothetical protein
VGQSERFYQANQSWLIGMALPRGLEPLILRELIIDAEKRLDLIEAANVKKPKLPDLLQRTPSGGEPASEVAGPRTFRRPRRTRC